MSCACVLLMHHVHTLNMDFVVKFAELRRLYKRERRMAEAMNTSGLGDSIVSANHDDFAPPASTSTDSGSVTIQSKKVYYDIMIMGRSGMGKSTLGNKLLRVHDTCYSVNRQYSTTFVDGRGISGEFEGFNTSEDKDVEKDQAVTKECRLVANESEQFETIRVLDTPGFHSKKFGMDMKRANLQKFRWIAHEQANPHNNMAVKRLLYFLPDRSTDWKSDSIVQDDLEVMHYFFGTAVFDHMVAIATQAKKYQGVEFTSVDEEEVQSKFHKAIIAATDSQMTDSCPPVIYIGFNDSSDVVLNKVKQARVIGKGECFKPKFREDVCSRCSGELQYRESVTERNIPIGILRKHDHGIYIEKYEESKCHPYFIRKYSDAEKIAGGVGHVATLLIPYAVATALDMESWPGFFNSDEMCPHCKGSPGSEGCCPVEKQVEVEAQPGQLVSVTVRHTCKL